MSMSDTLTIEPSILMSDLIVQYPGAQRALFRKYHIGGCASCGYQPTETLADVCKRNENLPVGEVIGTILEGHEADLKMQVDAKEAAELVKEGKAKIVDVRSREEYEAVKIEGSTFMTQELMQVLGNWPREQLIILVCHHGFRSLDAAAYFQGHGLHNVRSMRGGIDAWSLEVDQSLPQYELE